MRKKKPKPARPVTVSADGKMVDDKGKAVTQNPLFSKYRWIKLHVDSWLDGTTRWTVSGAQRAFWIDLLCESARGRFPGWICAGQDAGKVVGYPLAWYQAKQLDPLDVLATLTFFEKTGKVRIVTTCKSPLMLAVEILGWSRFQSDLSAGAQRAKRHREKKKAEAEAKANTSVT